MVKLYDMFYFELFLFQISSAFFNDNLFFFFVCNDNTANFCCWSADVPKTNCFFVNDNFNKW